MEISRNLMSVKDLLLTALLIGTLYAIALMGVIMITGLKL